MDTNIGTISMFSSGTLPAGWLACDGSVVNKTSIPNGFHQLALSLDQNPDLETVTLPKLNNKFVVGADAKDNVLGSSSDNPDYHKHKVVIPTKSFSTSTNGEHTHGFPDGWYDGSLTSGNASIHFLDRNGKKAEGLRTTSSGGHNHSFTIAFESFYSNTNKPETTGGSINNEFSFPKYTALVYMIYVGTT